MINLVNSIGLIIGLSVLIVVFFLHLLLCIKYKKHLYKLKPYAWVKEELSKTEITIKCEIVTVIVLCIALIVILLI